MKKIDLRNPEKSLKPLVVALGYFDGVHLGHQKLLEKVMKHYPYARVAMLTLSNSPKTLLSKREEKLLTTLEDRERLIPSEMELLVVEFGEKELTITASEFANFLIKLGVWTIVCGEDYRFGAGQKGNCALLKKLVRGKIKIDVEPQLMLDDEVVSTTAVIAALRKGDINKVNHFLGREYDIILKADNDIYHADQYILPMDGKYKIRHHQDILDVEIKQGILSIPGLTPDEEETLLGMKISFVAK